MSRKPTHLLKVKERSSEARCTIGVGWLNEDGSMSIALNPCVVLTSKDDVIINLFPIEEESEASKPKPWTKHTPKPVKTPKVIVPEQDSNGHDFAEIGEGSHNRMSVQRCSKCDFRAVVNIPYDGIKVDPCPKV